MSRIDPDEFKKTFDTDLSDGAIQAWLDGASLDVDEIQQRDSSISSERLEQIELRLAQAKATGQDPRIDSASRETGSVSYGENMDYWSMAVGLDPTGYLSGYGKPKAGMSVSDSKGIE